MVLVDNHGRSSGAAEGTRCNVFDRHYSSVSHFEQVGDDYTAHLCRLIGCLCGQSSSSDASALDSRSGASEGSDDISDEITESFLSVLRQPRKKRIRDRRVRLVPRLIRSDVRRYFAQMFVNAMNSHSPDMLHSFFERYATPTLSMAQHCSLSMDPHAKGSATWSSPSTICGVDVCVRGLSNVVRYWALTQELVPDETVTVASDVTILRRPGDAGDSAEIHLQFGATATFVYDVAPPYYAYATLANGDRAALDTVNRPYTGSALSRATSSDAPPCKRPTMKDFEISVQFVDGASVSMRTDINSHKKSGGGSRSASPFAFCPRKDAPPVPRLIPTAHPRPATLSGHLVMHVAPDRRIEALNFSSIRVSV